MIASDSPPPLAASPGDTLASPAAHHGASDTPAAGASTGAGEPRVLAVDLDLALEIATVALGGVTYRVAIDDDRADAGVIAPLWRRTDTAADAALSPHEDALTRDLTAFVRSEAA